MSKKHEKRIKCHRWQKGKCCVCGVQTRIEANLSDPDLAVLKNSYGFFDPKRHIDEPNQVRWKIYCLNCSRQLDREHNKKVPVEILREVSGAYPLGHPLAKD